MAARPGRRAISRPGVKTDPKAAIRERALSAGFDAVGIAAAETGAAAKRDLSEFIAQGLHGDMGWMADTADRRADPAVLWPEARSVIVVGANYGPPDDPLAPRARRDRATVSVYARGSDYHDILKKRLRALARWVHETYDTEVKLFVDTAPVMEKPLAERAGLGWQGKHTNLVSRDFGSWLFLGEIFTTLPLVPDAPHADRCGGCRRCLDSCPTDAFPAPYRLDARRCISYLTIEHKGHIPAELREPIGNRIYGCDDCLAVCPWNKFASLASEAAFWPRVELTAPRLADLVQLDEASFRRLFAGSTIKRTGRDRFVRNVLIAIGNSADAALAPLAQARLTDPSPLVRAMAVWALGRLLGGEAFKALRDVHLRAERDPHVREEWGESAPAERSG